MTAHIKQRHAFAAYGQAAQTLPPARQIVMLYDGALHRLRDARAAIESDAFEERFQAIAKASAIIDALQGCIDFERGSQVARLLDNFYSYVGFRLQRINITNDPTICDELIERLDEMRAAWSQISGHGHTNMPTYAAGPVTGDGAMALGDSLTT